MASDILLRNKGTGGNNISILELSISNKKLDLMTENTVTLSTYCFKDLLLKNVASFVFLLHFHKILVITYFIILYIFYYYVLIIYLLFFDCYIFSISSH